MKKGFVVFMVVCLSALVMPLSSFAEKGASEQGREHASDQAIFNRVGDWFATVGKSEEEKEAIKAERQAERKAKKVEKKAKEMKGEAEDKAKEAKIKAEKSEKQMKEKMQKEKNKKMK